MVKQIESINFDRGQYEVIEIAEGLIRACVTVAKPGVYPYVVADGSIQYEARLPEELFSAATINSINGAPATNEHPRENNSYVLVDTNNYKKYNVGFMSDPKIENDSIVAFETIYDKETIDKIKIKKHKEVSIGFQYVLDMTPGIYNGVAYDAVQRKIRVNHVAHVQHGRGGPEVKIHIDKGEKMTDQNNLGAATAGQNVTVDTIFSFRLDNGTDISVSKEVHTELMNLKNKIKADGIELETLKSKMAEQNQKNEFDTMRAAVDEWKNKYQELQNNIPGMVAESAKNRINLISVAKTVKPDQNFDSMSEHEIKLQVITKGLPFKSETKFDTLTDLEIDSRFDAAVELLKFTAINVSSVTQNDSAQKASIGDLYNKFGGK